MRTISVLLQIMQNITERINVMRREYKLIRTVLGCGEEAGKLDEHSKSTVLLSHLAIAVAVV